MNIYCNSPSFSHQLQCCGGESSKDWEGSYWAQEDVEGYKDKKPPSCCKKPENDVCGEPKRKTADNGGSSSKVWEKVGAQLSVRIFCVSYSVAMEGSKAMFCVYIAFRSSKIYTERRLLFQTSGFVPQFCTDNFGLQEVTSHTPNYNC